MSTSRVVLAALAVGIVGCFNQAPNPPTASPKAAPAKILGLPLAVTVEQRSTTILPGTHGELSVTADDITRGQVMVSLICKDGAAIFGPVSMKERDSQSFVFGNASYSIRVAKLHNALVGNDFASLVISESIAKTFTEDQKIERLIAAVESLDRTVFVRNGREHTAREAGDHMRRKLTLAREQIGSATEFIDLIASKSSLTGDEYQIRMPDGHTLSARDYFLQELAKLPTSR